jgi:MOSC domain-containing protein YiiM
MRGRLVGIYTASDGGKPMHAHAEIRAIAGAGLEGDRYAIGTGEFSDREGAGREVTLVAREAIAAANAEDVAIGEHESRRNLVTEGVDLDALIGQEFAIGDVVLVAVRDCPPCAYLERLTGRPVRRGLRGRGGLRADIVQEGTLRVGDPISTRAQARTA